MSNDEGTKQAEKPVGLIARNGNSDEAPSKPQIAQDLRKEMHEHAWKHFTVHAQQRMTSFHFYLFLSTVVCGGVFALARDLAHPCFAAFFSLLLPCLSFVFWKLDVRNQELIDYSERALMHLEEQTGLPDTPFGPHVLKIFTSEDSATRKRETETRAHFRYKRCFEWVFKGAAALGVILFLVFLFVPLRKDEKPHPQEPDASPNRETRK